MKALRILFFALAAVSLLAAFAFATTTNPPTTPPPPTPSDSSHFGNTNNGATTLPGSGTVPGDMNNDFHDNTGGSGFGSGF